MKYKRTMNYPIEKLGGEIDYRKHIHKTERYLQGVYRLFQNWRMNVGLEMEDIDWLASDDGIESFGSVKNLETSKIGDIVQNYAIMEMKFYRTPKSVINSIVKKSTGGKELANMANLPYFVVKYLPDVDNGGNWEFTVYPANPIACKFLPEAKHMSERQYVNFLYSVRGLKNPPVKLVLECSVEKSVDNKDMKP